MVRRKGRSQYGHLQGEPSHFFAGPFAYWDRPQPVPFARPRPQTVIFLRQFFTALILSSQSPSPALIQTTTGTRRDREALERVFVKAAPFPALVKGLLYFLETGMDEEDKGRQKEQSVIKWGKKIARETLSIGGGMIDVR